MPGTIDFDERRGPDVDGHDRRIIVFELTPLDAFNPTVSDDQEINEEIWQLPLPILRERAIASTTEAKSPTERRYIARYRSHAVRVYVLRRADGICEACNKDAPFKTSSGRPYLEPHHIRRLSDDGPDHPQWVISLCPNCHRHAHHGDDKKEFNQNLKNIVKEKES